MSLTWSRSTLGSRNRSTLVLLESVLLMMVAIVSSLTLVPVTGADTASTGEMDAHSQTEALKGVSDVKDTNEILNGGGEYKETSEGQQIDLPPSAVASLLWQDKLMQMVAVGERYRRGGSSPTRNYTGGEGGTSGIEEEEMEEVEDNCTHPHQPLPQYNDSCDFVHAECSDKTELIDYLAFVLCDLPNAQVDNNDSVSIIIIVATGGSLFDFA